MSADGILNHCQKRLSTVSSEDRPFFDIDVALNLDRVCGREPVGGVVGVVTQEIDGLLAFEVRDGQRFPFSTIPDQGILGSTMTSLTLTSDSPLVSPWAASGCDEAAFKPL